MSVISGKYGKVQGYSTVKNWSISHSADLQPLIASNTLCYPVRIDGNKDWTGSFEAYGKEMVAALFPGKLFQFLGGFDADGVASASVYGVDSGASGCIVESVEMKINIANGDPLMYTVNFAGNNDLTIGLVAVTADTTSPEMWPTVDTGGNVRMTWGDATVDVLAVDPTTNELPDITEMTLNISCDLKDYVSSDSTGFVKRIAGTYDLTCSVAFYHDEFDNSGTPPIPHVNDILAVNLYINATEAWQIGYLKVNELSDLTVDIESGDIIGATLNMEFSAYVKESATSDWNVGWIGSPLGVDHFGSAPAL